MKSIPEPDPSLGSAESCVSSVGMLCWLTLAQLQAAGSLSQPRDIVLVLLEGLCLLSQSLGNDKYQGALWHGSCSGWDCTAASSTSQLLFCCALPTLGDLARENQFSNKTH